MWYYTNSDGFVYKFLNLKAKIGSFGDYIPFIARISPTNSMQTPRFI